MRDDMSFVSLGATFKPDDASSLATTETERNWNTVFVEAVAVPHESDLPVAQAQAVHIDEEGCEAQMATSVEPDLSANSVQRCNCVVVVIGYAHLILAVAAAFGTELAAVSVFLLGKAFYWISQKLKHRTWAIPVQTLFLILTALMLTVDLMVLTIGIFMVELVAWVACGLCILFGGISVGLGWQQHIRKVCHLTRWAFRGFHATWEPKRMQPFSDTTGETATDNTGGIDYKTNHEVGIKPYDDSTESHKNEHS